MSATTVIMEGASALLGPQEHFFHQLQPTYNQFFCVSLSV